jgi:hypothetical protein
MPTILDAATFSILPACQSRSHALAGLVCEQSFNTSFVPALVASPLVARHRPLFCTDLIIPTSKPIQVCAGELVEQVSTATGAELELAEAAMQREVSEAREREMLHGCRQRG